jgi:DNA-binding transcriptional regulator LsrR (DeoR family)
MDSEVYSQSRVIIARAAKLYYLDHVPQRLIARDLGISVPTVSRLLTRARTEGLVRFTIPEPYASCLALELDLRDAFDLVEVLVVPVEDGDPEATKRSVALEGARLVQRLTTSEDTLGVAWGGTMYHLIQYLNPCRRVPASFVTLHGSISKCGPELNPAGLVERMAMAFGGHRRAITQPGLQPSVEDAQRLQREADAVQVRSLYDRITVSVSGVGSMYPTLDSRLVRSEYFTDAELTELRQAGVYGDMVLRFFGEDGQECDTSLRDRTLAIPLDVYRGIPRKIVAANGAHKAQTIRAVLRGGLVDILVVDEDLARATLELA